MKCVYVEYGPTRDQVHLSLDLLRCCNITGEERKTSGANDGLSLPLIQEKIVPSRQPPLPAHVLPTVRSPLRTPVVDRLAKEQYSECRQGTQD